MSDLHLTDKQTTELSGMGALGKQAAKTLRLWRSGNRSETWKHRNWLGSDIVIESRDSYDDGVMILSTTTDTAGSRQLIDAIVHARNSAELMAALTYWTEKKHMCREAYSHQLEQGLSVGDEWPGWGDLAAANITLSAIVAALGEIE